ncbi:MAG: hypothetical protein ABSF59_21920 [Candidatus Sulfotelmatobacter sp.]|jgi:hypothetical protein
MIPFIAKMWFLWWMLAIAAGVRCYHRLCIRSQVETLDPAIFVEEEEAAGISSLLLQHAQIVSLPETQGAF